MATAYDDEADRIRREMLTPERLLAGLRKASQAGVEHAAAIGMIRGTAYSAKTPAERVELIERVLAALDSLREELS